MDKKLVFWILAGLIVLIGGLLLIKMEKEPAVIQPDKMDEASQVAEEWVRNSSPTYTFDGTDLNLVSEKELVSGGRYQFIFSFVSSAAGYGDRSGQMAAQVITPHTIKIVVENDKVVSAVTDQVFDEIEGEMVDEDITEDELALETLAIEVYFVQVVDGQEKVVPVEREIPYTVATARAAIEELLKGPLPEEKEAGLTTAINENTQLQSIEIEDGVAQVDFNQRLDEGVAGSARVTMIKGQIEKTLLQFETVDEVIISVDGEVEEILQP